MGLNSICERLNDCCQCRGRRWFLLIFGLIELFWFGGYYYAYNALIPIYQELGVFVYACQANETTCAAQEAIFHNGFTIWVVVQMCLITGAGFLMDRVGLRALKLFAALGYFIGTMMFAFTKRTRCPLYFVAGIFVALASTSNLICNHQISSLFPKYRGFAVSLMSGAFDSSGVVVYIISNKLVDITLQSSFIIIACCSLVYTTMMSLFGMKQWSRQMAEGTEFDDNSMETAPEKGDVLKIADESHQSPAVIMENKIQRFLEKRYTSFGSCVKSWPFVLVSLWFMFALLRFCYFLTQTSQQLKFLFGDDTETIDKIKKDTSAMLLCGFLFAPISGIILDVSRSYYRRQLLRRLEEGDLSDNEMYWTHLRGIAPAFLVLAVSATAMSALNFVESKATYYIAFIFFVIVRSLLFSGSVSFVLIAFPIQQFGAVNGLVNAIGGIFSLLQHALLRTDATAGNGIAIAMTSVLFISPLIMFCKRR